LLRITGGTHRGRQVRTPAGDATRPTSDRVRQALFNLLGQTLDDALVLDVFAGSGALGLEALSRGAQRLWSVDKARSVCDVIRRNAEDLGLADRVTVVCGDAVTSLGRVAPGAATLALCDPPYDLRDRDELFAALAAALAVDGTLVFESSGKDPVEMGNAPFERTDRREYGSSVLHIFRRT